MPELRPNGGVVETPCNADVTRCFNRRPKHWRISPVTEQRPNSQAELQIYCSQPWVSKLIGEIKWLISIQPVIDTVKKFLR